MGYLRICSDLLLACFLFDGCTEATVTWTSTLTSFTESSVSICSSRTVNYITQTLPQQCLRTNWSNELIIGDDKNTTSLLENAKYEKAHVPIAVSTNITGPSSPSTQTLNSQTKIEPLSTGTALSQATQIQTLAVPTVSISIGSDAGQDNDADPLSDNANFLSFEEWKAQMLKKAGQSPEYVGTTRPKSDRPEGRRQPPGISNALDSLGEDNEIELDFSGFTVSDTAPDRPAGKARKATDETKAGKDPSEGKVPTPGRKSKDAGTTCKERFNYASFDCAATVLKTNPECKGSTSVLVENKDSYMLNACSAKNKFFIVELCNDILIDTIVLGNFEFFSSTFRTFRVSVSDRYPVKIEKWKELGTFEARNTREVQAFLVENALIWARYLRIEFLTHYGNEHYCPVSLLRIHGKTMMDDYRNEVKATRGEEEQDDEVLEDENETKGVQSVSIATDKVSTQPLSATLSQDSPEPNASKSIPNSTVELPAVNAAIAASNNDSTSAQGNAMLSWVTYRSPLVEQYEMFTSRCQVSKAICNLKHIQVLRTLGPNPHEPVLRTPRSHILSSLSSVTKSSVEKSSSTVHPENGGTLSNATTTLSNPKSSEEQDVKQRQNSSNTTLLSSKARTTEGTQSASKTSHSPPAPSPTTQESFFKSVHKRLQLLEANSTLSLQYIEEQSRILREAFTKVEKRQLTKTTTFLETLNTTVLSELREFRLQYDQIWQSTVLELSSQREQSQREVIALSARLSILADEVLFQKRMAILQFILILLCLGLVMFSRSGAAASSFELGNAVHDMVMKPSTSFSRYLHLDSPPGTPSRPSSRYGLFSRPFHHVRSPSNESTLNDNEIRSPSIEYQPPTPTSSRSQTGEPMGLGLVEHCNADMSQNEIGGSPPSADHRHNESNLPPPASAVEGLGRAISTPNLTLAAEADNSPTGS